MDNKIRSRIVPIRTTDPRSERIMIVTIAPAVRSFYPFAGSSEHTRLFIVVLVELKIVWINDVRDGRSQDDGHKDLGREGMPIGV